MKIGAYYIYIYHKTTYYHDKTKGDIKDYYKKGKVYQLTKIDNEKFYFDHDKSHFSLQGINCFVLSREFTFLKNLSQIM